ncbi:NAD-dependent epimerase/dehydratase family protein [Sphingobacterium thalpophilum]|uniref:NAD-dependent epimerase/dehydratase family protein n=1 Tax=Sphingobacterium thalpophilum TaxID=259 RepID=UPI003DA4EE96
MIIITGASGFVGHNMSSYLANRGEDIFSLSLRQPNWRDVIPFQGKGIIHLAGKAHDTANTSAEEEYFKVNTDLTIDLFKEFLKSEIKDFFYFSSVKAVADTVEGILVEDVEARAHTPYGKSKLKTEQFLLAQSLPVGKRVFIVRPCMIHGPGNKGNLNLLYKVVEKGIPWPLASFHNKRSFLGIDNLLFLIHAMLEKEDLPSGVYNFADDDSLSTNDLVILIAKVLGKRAKLWNIPPALIRATVKIGDILPLPLNSERLKKLTESYVVSNDKIKKALNIDLLPVDLEGGLIKTIKSFQ